LNSIIIIGTHVPQFDAVGYVHDGRLSDSVAYFAGRFIAVFDKGGTAFRSPTGLWLVGPAVWENMVGPKTSFFQVLIFSACLCMPRNQGLVKCKWSILIRRSSNLNPLATYTYVYPGVVDSKYQGASGMWYIERFLCVVCINNHGWLKFIPYTSRRRRSTWPPGHTHSLTHYLDALSFIHRR
jgi:hypothetical protein